VGRACAVRLIKRGCGGLGQVRWGFGYGDETRKWLEMGNGLASSMRVLRRGSLTEMFRIGSCQVC